MKIGSGAAEVVDGTEETLFEVNLDAVAEVLPGARDVGERVPHVPGAGRGEPGGGGAESADAAARRRRSMRNPWAGALSTEKFGPQDRR